MKNLRVLCVLGIIGLLGACTLPGRVTADQASEARERADALQALRDMQPHWDAITFRCNRTISLTNQLRHLGKDRALQVLQTYYSQTKESPFPEHQISILCICRLLFSAPGNGWKQPWADALAPDGRPVVSASWDFNKEDQSKFPLYPIAVCDGVPFSLVYAWNSAVAPGTGKIPDEAGPCLELCRHLEMIPHDLPATGWDQASIKLCNSAAFNRLYKGKVDLESIRLWVTYQAIDHNGLGFGPSSAR